MPDETIQLPDGSGPLTVPEWAKEETLKKMLLAINNLQGATKKTKEAAEKLATAAKEGNAAEAKADTKLLSAIGDMKDDDGGSKPFKPSVKSLGVFRAALTVAGSAVGLFVTGIVASYAAIKGIGDDLRGQKGGTGLDIGGPMGNAAQFRTAMQSLGYSAEEVTTRFEDASQVIAIAGRDTFVTLTKEIQDITGAGSDYALTLAQMGDALDDDLKLRQAIGILNMLDGNKQAQRSAELYEYQLKATTILGKSIESISGSADDTLTTNASVQLLIQSMGKGAHEFTTQVQRMAGDMTASGLGQGVNNAIQNAMLESVAFRTDAGGDLFQALTALDATAGTDLRQRIQAINAMAKTDPIKAGEMMQDFNAVMVGGAKDLTDEQLESLRPVIENFGQLGQQMMLSIGQMRQAGMGIGPQFSDLAKGAATVTNAMTKFKTGIAGSMNSLLAAFGTPLSRVMEAFTKTTYSINGRILADEELAKMTNEQVEALEKEESLFMLFNMQLESIRLAFMGLFDLTTEGGSKMKDFVEILKKKITPLIEGFGSTVVDWIGKWTAESVEATIDKIILWFGFIADAAEKVGKGLAWMVRLLVATDTVDILDENDLPTGETKEVFNFKRSILYALTFAFGASILKNAISGAFAFGMSSLGTLGGGLLSKIPKLGGLAGQGATAEAAGSKFGKGAVGMAAFGVAMAGVGVAAFGLSEGVKTLGEMEWEDIKKGIGGLTLALLPFAVAIGLLAWAGTGPQTLGLWSIAGVLAAIGAAAAGIGATMVGVARLKEAFGETSEEKIAEQDAMTKNVGELSEISKEQLDSTASGIVNIARAMEAFGDATNDGWFSGPDLDDQEKQLGIFAKFARLDGTKLTAFTDGMNELIETINRLNALDTAVIVARADALAQLNEAASGPGFGERFSKHVADRIFGNSPTPQVATANAAPIQVAGTNQAVIEGRQQDSQVSLLMEIRDNTKTGPGRTATKLAEVIS